MESVTFQVSWLVRNGCADFFWYTDKPIDLESTGLQRARSKPSKNVQSNCSQKIVYTRNPRTGATRTISATLKQVVRVLASSVAASPKKILIRISDAPLGRLQTKLVNAKSKYSRLLFAA